MERYCSNPTAGLIKNMTNKCSSRAEGDDDSYVEMAELGERQASSQSTDSDDDDDDYVNTEEPNCHPTSKQSTESDDDDDDDDYVNTVDQHRDQTFKQGAGNDDDDGGGEDYVELDDHPIPEQSTVTLDAPNHVIQRKPASSNRGLKIVLVILVLLLLSALAALCALMILYLDNVAAFHTIREQHANATAHMIMQQHKASVRMDIYTKLKKKYQRVQEFFSSTCNVSGFCDEGWKPLGLKCYFFYEEKLNWMKSRDSCVNKGADLVIITSQAEQKFVSSQAKGTSWIGLNYLETEGMWMWVNNQTLEETGVTFWNEAPTSPPGEMCVSVGDQSGSKWFAQTCRTDKRYICEK